MAEFRVLTSNFKAEYEDAGTSIITAITRSGTNDFHGEIFGTYQDDEHDRDGRDCPADRRDNPASDFPEPDSPATNMARRWAARSSATISSSSPATRRNIQDRANTVTPGGDAAAAGAVAVRRR